MPQSDTVINPRGMSQQALVNAVYNLQLQLNNLRADVIAHDHGSTYGATALRINATADTVTGTPASATLTLPISNT
jgi:hypothetical protein